jgi:hypothetical protein
MSRYGITPFQQEPPAPAEAPGLPPFLSRAAAAPRSILTQISRDKLHSGRTGKARTSQPREEAELTVVSLKGFYSESFRWLVADSLQELSHLDRKLDYDSRGSCSRTRT